MHVSGHALSCCLSFLFVSSLCPHRQFSLKALTNSSRYSNKRKADEVGLVEDGPTGRVDDATKAHVVNGPTGRVEEDATTGKIQGMFRQNHIHCNRIVFLTTQLSYSTTYKTTGSHAEGSRSYSITENALAQVNTFVSQLLPTIISTVDDATEDATMGHVEDAVQDGNVSSTSTARKKGGKKKKGELCFIK